MRYTLATLFKIAPHPYSGTQHAIDPALTYGTIYFFMFMLCTAYCFTVSLSKEQKSLPILFIY